MNTSWHFCNGTKHVKFNPQTRVPLPHRAPYMAMNPLLEQERVTCGASTFCQGPSATQMLFSFEFLLGLRLGVLECDHLALWHVSSRPARSLGVVCAAC